jgi:hypothetical protein
MAPPTDTDATIPWQQEDATVMGNSVFYEVCPEML